ncbi:hypothetical protein [Rhizobium sp. WW_1]|jgi:hypothetical protein|uniref:hypothetical protein n=1 Tax=Rhizobium sp. WW_1 TaxID=1907375 RepID=UPI000648D82A|nr:hypothetical protein [Rhizobium sp. WW_1]RKD69023.1 hypothetical protein BJ928_104161 [Rhizobium sp. WW_1]
MSEFLCSMPECQTTAGCSCRRSGIIYTPQFVVPPYAFDPDPPTRAYVDTLKAEIESLRSKLSERQRTDDLIEEVKRVLRPFNQMAGELFSRNWNASDLVLALDNPGQENRLTAGDIFAVRALLSKLEVRS